MVHGAPTRKKSNASNNNNTSGIPRCEQQLDDSDLQPVPPDGGWGWMVLFGFFMIHIISKCKI